MKRKIGLLFMLYVEWINRRRICRCFLDEYLRSCGLNWFEIKKVKHDYIWHYKVWEKKNYES